MNAFDRKTMAIEAPGDEPAELHIIAPTVVRPGDAFSLKVAVADAMGYPSVKCREQGTIHGDFAYPTEWRTDFGEGNPAVAQIDGITIPTEGFYRFRGEIAIRGQKRVFWSNPVCCKSDGPFIYWGDPHVHTVLSDCHPGRCRSLNFCYVAARWFAGLDWVSAADHVSNGRCTPGKWREQIALSEAFNDPPNFVTLPAYEASFKGGAGGDANVYMRRWPDLFVEDYDRGTIQTMCRGLAEKLTPSEEFFVVPHHTTRTGKHGEIGPDIYPGEALMPVVEIHSKWGTSEYRGNPNPLHQIHPGPSYAVDLLNRGLKLGFIGGTDTHSTMPAGFGDEHLDRLPGLTAVFADELTRHAIYDGIRTRNCYATSLERLYLDVCIADVGPGSTIKWSNPNAPRYIRVVAAARSEIVSLEVVRNGRTIETQSPNNWQGTLECIDEADLNAESLISEPPGRFAYYYVRVTCASGAQAWSSPIWLLL